MAYFKGPFILSKHVERLILGGDIDIGSQSLEPTTNPRSEGAIVNSAQVFTSMLPPHSLVLGLISFP